VRYRIVCTEQEPADRPPDHAHIVAVGTGTDPAAANMRWTLEEVLRAMRSGDAFYTEGVESGRVAQVQEYECRSCRRTFIRSAPDCTYDNNLDYLRRCGSWSS